MTYPSGPGDPDATGPCDSPEAVARDIADAVDCLTSLWSLAAQGALVRLSLHQLRALRALESAAELNLTALAEHLEIGLPAASRLCDRLEAAGLLERAWHPRKRREVRLALSVQGRHVLEDVAARRSRALAEVLAGMKASELALLSRGMKAFLTGHELARRNGVWGGTPSS